MFKNIDDRITGLENTIINRPDFSDTASRKDVRHLVFAALPEDIRPDAIERLNVLSTYAAANTEKGDRIAKAEARQRLDILVRIKTALLHC